MDTPTQLVVIAKRILRELAGLTETIRAGFSGTQQQIHSLGHQLEQVERTPGRSVDPPPVFNLQAELQVPESERRERRATENRQFIAQVILTVVTFLAFIAAAVYAGIAALQLRQMKVATEKAGISADAAACAAKTASQALKHSEDAFKIEQRPYMVSGSPQFIEPLANGSTAKADIVFQNVGHTPAIGVVNIARLTRISFANPQSRTNKLLTSRIEEIFKVIAGEAAQSETTSEILSRLDVAPSATNFFITRELTTPLSDDELTKLKSGDLVLVYMGIVKYKFSVAPTQPPFETEFCSFYFGDDPKTWHYCPTHNTIR